MAASHPKKLTIKIWHEESDVLIRIIDSGGGLQIEVGIAVVAVCDDEIESRTRWAGLNTGPRSH